MTRIVALSDTHERHAQIKIPDGDWLIHCGDFTNRGSEAAVRNFLDWFMSHPHRFKAFILGNHEISFSGNGRHKYFNLVKDSLKSDVHFLHNSSAVIDGFKVYGSPHSPAYGGWAFERNRGKDIAIEWAKIPLDTEILLTHGPSYGTLDLVEDNSYNRGRDLHQGCRDLKEAISKLPKLKLHCAGHLHLMGGQQTTIDGVVYVNAACCTEDYEPTNKPVIIDL